MRKKDGFEFSESLEPFENGGVNFIDAECGGKICEESFEGGSETDIDISELVWQLFSGSGKINYYLLYKALTEIDIN
jgi:hypothetical protein